MWLIRRFITCPMRYSSWRIHAMRGEPGSSLVRFGIFEADLQACELRKRGIRIRLQAQPFQLLATLLEQPGQVVTRQELQMRLWAGDTFVDFDRGVNKAISQIR
jgi:DNA-binding response OmpR family regulator